MNEKFRQHLIEYIEEADKSSVNRVLKLMEKKGVTDVKSLIGAHFTPNTIAESIQRRVRIEARRHDRISERISHWENLIQRYSEDIKTFDNNIKEARATLKEFEKGHPILEID